MPRQCALTGVAPPMREHQDPCAQGFREYQKCAVAEERLGNNRRVEVNDIEVALTKRPCEPPRVLEHSKHRSPGPLAFGTRSNREVQDVAGQVRPENS